MPHKMASFFYAISLQIQIIVVYLSYKIEAVLAESGNSSNYKKYRDKRLLPMAGHAFG